MLLTPLPPPKKKTYKKNFLLKTFKIINLKMLQGKLNHTNPMGYDIALFRSDGSGG